MCELSKILLKVKVPLQLNIKASPPGLAQGNTFLKGLTVTLAKTPDET